MSSRIAVIRLLVVAAALAAAGACATAVSDVEQLESELFEAYGHPVRVSVEEDSTLTIAYDDAAWWTRDSITGRRAVREVARMAHERFPGSDTIARVRVVLARSATGGERDSSPEPLRYAWPAIELTPAPTDPVEGMLTRNILLLQDTIRLGEPLPNPDRYTDSEQDTVIVLPTGSFGGADGMVVYRRPSGEVYRVAFLYGAHWDADTLLAQFRRRLGKPRDAARANTASGLEETWLWRERRTSFSLIRFTPPRDGIVAIAWMLDRRRK